MPTQAPSLSDVLDGEIELSADQPAVAVEIEVVANAALMADATSSADVEIRRAQPNGGPGEPALPVLLSIEALDRPPTIAVAEAWGEFHEFLDRACPGNGECRRRYRLTAVLADPTAIDEPVTIGWTAVAESRTGSAEAPAPAPAGATLTLRADDPVPLDGADLVTAASAPREHRLDASHPRVVQPIRLTRAQDVGGPGGPALGVQLRVETVADDDPGDVGWQFRIDGATSRSGHNDAGTIFAEMLACEDPAGCVDELTVVGEWVGGDPTEGETARWSLAAAAFARGDADSRPAAGSILLEPGEVVAVDPQRAGETSGEFATGGRESVRYNVRVSVGGAEPPGAEGPLLVQATIRAETDGPDAADGEVRIGAAGAWDLGPAGVDLLATSQVMPVDCSGGPCQVAFQVEGSAQQYPAGSVDVRWTLEIALLAEPPVSVGPDTTVDITVTEAPS